MDMGTGFTEKLLYLLQITAFLSLNLGVMNLLPFPALDGGKLVVILIEKFAENPRSGKRSMDFNGWFLPSHAAFDSNSCQRYTEAYYKVKDARTTHWELFLRDIVRTQEVY